MYVCMYVHILQIQLGGLMLPRKFHEIEVRLFCKYKHLPGIHCTHCPESEKYVYNYSAGFHTGYNNYSGIKIHTRVTTCMQALPDDDEYLL